METSTLTSHTGPVRELGRRWLPSVAADPGVRAAGGDFACSPTGLWLALAAVAAGARGATAEELRALLGVAGDEAARAVTDAARGLARTDALAVATGVWARVPVHERLRAALPDVGFGTLGVSGTPDAAPSPPVDAWVREATGGLIGGLPVHLSPGIALLLVNALALKARWADPFDASETRDRPFTDASGAVHPVPTMHKQLPPSAAWHVGDVRVVELRCETRGDAPPALVRFVIGSPGRPAPEVLPAGWAPARLRAPVDADKVGVALPRLSLRTHLDVTGHGHAQALGLARCTGGDADFSGLSPEPLAVSEVVQEALVRVAEKGVEAAAVTAATMRALAFVQARVERIAFDRPFGVVVLDASGEVPLFVAWQATTPLSP
ncbi:serine protease [Streptomyces sp. RB6PN25]|uniref:Serine protease n=1 Tax=Streptomyces humicola TaxID=2953240 RepID=A0ABT1PUW4_9ACTN|nr:serpin family protein [Streptomyces humicola]MCQ4081468.1 serine protease [Streptomyces humicola]